MFLLDSFFDQCFYFLHREALLKHAVPVPDGDGSIFLGLVVYGDTEWGSDGILAAVTLSNCVLFFIKTPE